MKTYGVEITWLGHAAFRMRSAGKTFYFDPFLTPNPKCPDAEKQPAAADVILLSHGHMDHISDAVPLAKRTGAQVVAIVELGMYLAKQGVPQGQIVAMNKGGTIEQAGARISMVQALHTSSAEQDGVPLYLGEPAGYVVQFQEGLRVYFAGDTAVFGDMRLIGEIYRPRLACLPIGDFYTMGPLEAAYACRLLGIEAVIPMHFGTFPVLTGTPAELRRYLAEAGTPCEVLELQPGASLR
ncbi:MAG TPA: metal-dependent hydrolase [Terriglobales bacterium]|nr:metal-dependent hydrolase [Terriglobales bacterium]